MTKAQQRALLRWRLVLGRRAEEVPLPTGSLALAELAALWPETDVFGLDGCLEFIYEQEPALRFGGSDASRPHIPRWLGDIRRYFPQDVVALIQKDAIERKGLKQLLLEKETLPLLEKTPELVATILSLQSLIPDEMKATARQVVGEIVAEIRPKLETQIRQAVLGALKRNRHSPLPVYRNLDWKRTIHRNLKHYDRERRRLIPERFYFWANERRFYDWQVIICVDQSGSMATSVVYASIMAAIFASLSVFKTHLIFFDTSVVDMTDLLEDPVEVLFGAQLGGGTDIAQAVTYASRLVEQPEKTIFVLITDLYEGGDQQVLLAELARLVESRVRVLCLLALDDTGRPSFNHDLGRRVAALGVPTLGCTPRKLIEFIEDILAGRELRRVGIGD